jgi:hexokinase
VRHVKTDLSGGLADVQGPLSDALKKLDEAFTVPTAKLKQITDHFVNELKQGLTEEGGDIVSD